MNIGCVTITKTALRHILLNMSRPQKTIFRSVGMEKKNDSGTAPKPKKPISFNMKNVVEYLASTAPENELCKTVDDGAPCSEIINMKLRMLAQTLHLKPNPIINTVPDVIQEHTHWKHDTGKITVQYA